MFTTNHFIWLGICLILITAALIFLLRRKTPLRSVLTVCCALAVVSEYIKVFTAVKMLPLSGSMGLYPFFDPGHLPFHLCTIQIPLLFYTRFARPGKNRDRALAFMYPTCAAGAFFALLLPSIFPSSLDVSQAFVHPLAYQYFLFHTALFVLGLYIPLSGEIRLTPRRLLGTCAMITLLGFLSIYVNTASSSAVYENTKAAELTFGANFFFTMQPPIPIALTEKWQWIVYYGILHLIAYLLITALYLPFLLRRRRERRNREGGGQ